MKNRKASVLATSLIILGMILAIAIGISTVSIQERKSSSGSNRSGMAYQNADTGIEQVMNQIIKRLVPTDDVGKIVLNILETSCNSDGLIEVTGKFKVELKDSSEMRVRCDSGALVSSIASIKSTGTSGQENRAIEVALA